MTHQFSAIRDAGAIAQVRGQVFQTSMWVRPIFGGMVLATCQRQSMAGYWPMAYAHGPAQWLADIAQPDPSSVSSNPKGTDA